MKKVVKRGKKPEMEFDCNHCGCQFSSDEYTTSEAMAYKNVVSYTDKCPECKKRVTVSVPVSDE